MRLRNALASVLGVCLIGATSAFATGYKTLPRSYIVELADNHDIDSFYATLEAEHIVFSPLMNLTYTLFKGCSFVLGDSPSDTNAIVNKISGLPEVKELWPVRLYETTPPQKGIRTGDQNTTAQGMLEKRQQLLAQDTFSTHVMTQVDKLKAEGLTGKGIRVGIVDSGVDYRHQALGGCFGSGPGCVVSYGADLIGDDFDDFNPGVVHPDADPLDICNGHGTQIAGIIASQPNSFGFEGIAPGVKLGMYKVVSCSGFLLRTDIFMAGLNQAFEDGSHIISCSITTTSPWPEDAPAVVVQRIVEKGVPCIVAMGNNGNKGSAGGLFSGLTPGNGRGGVGIASVRNSKLPFVHWAASYRVDESPTTKVFGWQQPSVASPSFGNVTKPIWGNSSSVGDGCTPLPAGTPDLSPYIVLIRDGGSCGLVSKLITVGAKGAHHMMLYSVDESTPALDGWPGDAVDVQGLGSVTASQGKEWLDLLRDGHRVTLNIVEPFHTGQLRHEAPSPDLGGYLAASSAWGPTKELDLKPQFSAPGASILSTSVNGTYSVQSGTSFAAPFVAAIYALLAEGLGTHDPATLERRLSATANPNVFHDGKKAFDILAPTAQQGAGLVQAYDALHTATLLDTSSLAFNDTDHLRKSINFGIKNTSPNAVTYTLSNVRAATVYAFMDGFGAGFPPPMANAWAALSFSSSSLTNNKVTISGGGSAIITVTPTPPTGLDQSRIPIYSGYVAINGTNGDSLSIPYIGAVGSLYSINIMDHEITVLKNWTNVDFPYDPIPPNSTFVIPRPTGHVDLSAPHDIGYPSIDLNYIWGTAIMRVDVVPLEVSGPLPTKNVLGVNIAGSVHDYPKQYYAGGYDDVPFNGMLADGTVIPEGRYQLLLRGLRVFGDPAKPADYDTITLGPFILKYI